MTSFGPFQEQIRHPDGANQWITCFTTSLPPGSKAKPHLSKTRHRNLRPKTQQRNSWPLTPPPKKQKMSQHKTAAVGCTHSPTPPPIHSETLPKPTTKLLSPSESLPKPLGRRNNTRNCGWSLSSLQTPPPFPPARS